MAYYNPHVTGQYNPLYTANNQGFGHCPILFWILASHLSRKMKSKYYVHGAFSPFWRFPSILNTCLLSLPNPIDCFHPHVKGDSPM